MAITSGFFDSVNSDRLYDADQMSTYFEGLISDGVYENVDERFVVTSANDGMKVNVGSGRALLCSHWIKNDATATLTLDPSEVSQSRIDVVCLRLDTSERAISLTIKKGTSTTGTPTYDPPTRTATVFELYLAAILIGKGATQPTSITDLRPSTYCGWVTGIIKQVDTSDLFTQWQTAYQQQFAAFDAYMAAKQAAFDAWFADLTGELKVDTSITKFQNVVTVSQMDIAIMNITIGIPEYTVGEDVLFVYANGVFLAEGNEYNINSIGPSIDLNKKLNVGDEVTFVVLKNVVGGNVYAAVTALPLANIADGGTVVITEQEE